MPPECAHTFSAPPQALPSVWEIREVSLPATCLASRTCGQLRGRLLGLQAKAKVTPNPSLGDGRGTLRGKGRTVQILEAQRSRQAGAATFVPRTSRHGSELGPRMRILRLSVSVLPFPPL